jgi:hypothetical protein
LTQGVSQISGAVIYYRFLPQRLAAVFLSESVIFDRPESRHKTPRPV